MSWAQLQAQFKTGGGESGSALESHSYNVSNPSTHEGQKAISAKEGKTDHGLERESIGHR